MGKYMYDQYKFLISMIPEKLPGSDVGEEYESPERREPPPPVPRKCSNCYKLTRKKYQYVFREKNFDRPVRKA